MSDQPVASLELALLGNDASFQQMSERFDARLEKTVAKVESAGQRIQASLDRMLNAVSAGANKVNDTLQPLVGVLNEIGAASKMAGSEVKEASGELRDAARDARTATEAFNSTASAGRKMGESVSAGMRKTGESTRQAQGALGNFLNMVNRVRTAANKPIVQKVRVQNTGGGSTGSGHGGAAGYGLVMAGGAILGAEGELVKQGLEFDDTIRALYAHAGETAPMDAFKKSVLGVGQAFDQMPKDVGNALYPIESAGHHGAEALTVLTAAAAMARGTTTDLNTTTTLVTKTLTAYGLAADKSGQVTDIYTNAIRDSLVPGKEFVPAMSNVMDIGSKAGLTLQELSAALAMMTRTTKSAAVGSTYLKSFISGLITPTKAMRDAAETAGLGWLAAGRGAEHLQKVGLAETLREINAATKGGSESNVGKLFPDMRKNQALLSLLRNDAKQYAQTLKDVQKSGGAVTAANKVQDSNPAQGVRKLQAELATAGAQLETDLTPVLLKVEHLLDKVFQWFSRLSQPVQTTMAVVAGATGGLLALAGGLTLAVQWGSAFAGILEATILPALETVGAPLLAIGGAVALLVVGWNRDWGHIRETTAGVIAWARPYLAQFTGWLTHEWHALTDNLIKFWAAIRPEVMQILSVIVSFVRYQLAGLVSFWETWGQSIWGVVRAVWDGIKGFFHTALDAIEGLVKATLDLITGHWRAFFGDITTLGTTLGADFVSAMGHEWDDLKDGFVKTVDSMKAYWTAFWATLKSTGNLTDAMNAGSAAASVAHGGQMLGQAAAGTNGRSTVDPYGDPGTSPIGSAIAVQAEAMHKNIEQFRGYCERMVHETVGRLYAPADKYHRGSASQTMDAYKSAGIGFAYKPGMTLLPGDIWYTKAWGGKSGHTGVVGPGGMAYDNVGSGIAPVSQRPIQWVIRPDAPHGGAIATASEAPLRPPALSTDHSLADALNNKTTQKSAPSPMAHVPLKPLHDPYPPSLSGPTGADNYAAKLEHLDAALTDNQSTLQDSGAAYNTFSVELSGWAQKMMLADNAAQNTQKVMDALTPKVAASQKAYTDANAALNAQIDKTNRLRTAGAKVPASDKAELARLRERVQMTYAAAQADEKSLAENKRVHEQALSDANRFKGEYNRTNTRREQNATEWFLSDLKDHLNAPGQNGLTRDQYDNYLQAAMAGKNKDLGKMNPQGDDYKRIQAALEESQNTRANATSELGMKTLRLDHKDTQALQQELDEEVTALKKAGVDQNKIDEYVVKRTAEIHRAGFEQQRKDADDLQKVNMELGQETQADYQRYLISTLQAVQQEYGVTSLEVAKLKLAILQIDWDAVAQQADGYKAALDTGKLSIESYIVSLRDLQTNLPVTSEEYKRLGDEVESANKKIHDDAKAKADAVGGQFADVFMKVAEKAKTVKQVVHDALKDALETAAKDQIKQAFSKLAFKVIQQHDDRKMQDAVREHKPVVDKFAVGVTAFQGGVDKFGQWVAQFTEAMSQPVPGTGGAFGQGNTSGGGFGQGAAKDGSAFGGTASGSSPSGSSPSLTPQAIPAGKGNTAKSVASATNDINAGMEVANVAKNGVGSGIGAVSTAASLAGNIASVSKWASVGSALSAAAPYIGLVTTALALFGMFGSHKHTPTSTQGQNYANVLSSFSPTIDSGYSGSDGLRTLLGPTTRQAAGVSTAGQVQPGGHTLNITIASGAFQGVPDPQAHGTQVVQTIHDGIAQLDRLNNASRGEG